MEANMIALAKQKELDEQKRNKVSKKRMNEDITGYNKEKREREELESAASKRRKLSEQLPPPQQQQQP